MFRINMNSRKETVEAVLQYVMKSEAPSRPEIARACGISETAVSEIVKFFIDKSLFVKSLRAGNTKSGSRPERVRLDPKYYCIVFSFSDHLLKATQINADGKILERDMIVDPDITFNQNGFHLFTAGFSNKIMNTRSVYHFGTALIIPNYSHINKTDIVDIKDSLHNIIFDTFGTKRILIDTREEFASEAISMSDDKRNNKTLYLLINRYDISASFFFKGQMLPILQADRLSRIYPKGKNGDEIAHSLSEICLELRKNYGLNTIILDSEDGILVKGLADLLKEDFVDHTADGSDIPKIETIPSKKPNFLEKGAVYALKTLFAEDIVKTVFD